MFYDKHITAQRTSLQCWWAFRTGESPKWTLRPVGQSSWRNGLGWAHRHSPSIHQRQCSTTGGVGVAAPRPPSRIQRRCPAVTVMIWRMLSNSERTHNAPSISCVRLHWKVGGGGGAIPRRKSVFADTVNNRTGSVKRANRGSGVAATDGGSVPSRFCCCCCCRRATEWLSMQDPYKWVLLFCYCSAIIGDERRGSDIS